MKRSFLVGLSIIILIVLISIGLNFTGRVVLDSGDFGVFRNVPFKNIETNTTDVYVRIALLDNVIAIQENFSSGCEVLDYSLDSDIDIFEFNENENTWILANSSDTLDLELFYQIPYDCDVFSGKYYTIESFLGNDWCNGADTNKDGMVDAADYIALKRNMGTTCGLSSCDGADINKDGRVDWDDLQILQAEIGKSDCVATDENYINESANFSSEDIGVSSSNDGPSGSSVSPSGSSSSVNDGVDGGEIVQATSDEEYESRSLSIGERLAGIKDESQSVEKSSFYLFLFLIVIVVGILAIAIFLIFFRRPKDFNRV